jgi:protease IV
MSLDADQIVDRRRMRRKLTFWRVFGVLLVIGIVIMIGAALRTPGVDVLAGAGGDQIARITITGLITSDRERVAALDRLGRSRVKAVIVHINSPGGTTSGSEELHRSLIALHDKKPMVVVVDGMAASGGYIAAMAADHILTQKTSLVGSIGVLFQVPNVSHLLDTIGVKVEEIKSSPLKAAPNGLEPTSPEARAAIESLVRDSYAWFKDMVKERRKLDGEALDRVSDGRVFTGRQAIELKLVDEIGQEREAIEWLAKTNNIDPKTPVRDWRLTPRFNELSFIHLGGSALLEAFGLGTVARQLESLGLLQAVEKLNLDGLLALWHPSPQN